MATSKSNSSPKIELVNVRKSFDRKTVLSDLSLYVKHQESLVIIGGSGTGKSVTLKCILGLMNIDKGYVKIDGQNCTNLSGKDLDTHQSKFGMLFQGAALFDSLPVWKNVVFKLIQSGKLTSKQAKEKAIELLAVVGLAPDVYKLYPAELSGGMQKRVGLARAIAAKPEIIFFDEPTTGLDPIMADVINELIAKCVKEVGATALSITHDMTSVRKIADRVAMLYEGKIIWTGYVEDMEDSGNPYVEQFINGRADGPIKMGTV
ncbi:MAG: ATP-binding cassette domain-containing protein [Alphaproteobacteria bacterium]|nr:ATP-binding cassette domain-containing protein [Alphaproteobacteria bacterium]MCL2505064.1 ATP-binding cassette domain-containing protein [Alphaproteobacteria bacterium]